MSRSFKVLSVKSGGQPTATSFKTTTAFEGRYMSDTPRGAASKAFTNHCNAKNIHGQCTLVVTIQEITRGSSGKVYQYRAKRTKVDKSVMKDGKELVFRYENTLTSLKDSPVSYRKTSKHKGAPSHKPTKRRRSSTKK